MRTVIRFFKSIILTALLFTGLAAGSIAQDTTTIVNLETNSPVILPTSPTGGETNVDLSSVIEFTFSNEMNRNAFSESYTDTTQKGEMSLIDLGKAGQFVILAKTTINNESESMITGRTGEGSVTDQSKDDSKIDKVKKEKTFTGSVRQSTSNRILVLQSNRGDTTSTQSETTSAATDVNISEAIEDMMSAYSDASMQNGDDSTSHKNESFHDTELTSGIHEWSNSLHIESDVTLSGSEDNVWLFKVSDNLIIDENIVITLTDGARADNVFWHVEGEVTIGKNAQFEGIILSINEITLEKGAKLNGRIFSQSSITLDDNTVNEPRSMAGRTSSTNR